MFGIIIKIAMFGVGVWLTWSKLSKFLPSRARRQPDDANKLDREIRGVRLEKDPETGKFRPEEHNLKNEKE